MIDLLASLTPEQQSAVQTIDGPLLIIAGAGSGKTRTLVHRLAYLADVKGIPAEKLLAITFTTKAAEEMRSRVVSLCSAGIDLAELWIGTIHAFCYQILKNNGQRRSAVTDVKLVSLAEQALILKSLVPQFFPVQTASSIQHYARMISREKNDRASSTPTIPAHPSPFLQAYQAILEKEGLLDFDDLIICALELLRQHPSVAAQLRSRFTYISIDEYQDINYAQYLFMKELAGPAPNLCVVGDADQAIYAFRGAQVKIFLQFQEDFPSAKIVCLDQNYRSTSTIVTAAQQVIEKNTGRIDKKLVAVKSAGAPIELHELLDDVQEARFVAREIGRLLGGTRLEGIAHAHGENGSPAKSFSDIAVLYRLHAQSRLLRSALQRVGIPVQVAPGVSLYQEPEIEEIIALLEVISDPENDAALRRVLLAMVRGVGVQTVERLGNLARNYGRPLFSLLNADGIPGTDIPADKKTSLHAFSTVISALQERSATMPLDALIREICAKPFPDVNGAISTEELDFAKEENLLDLLTAVMPFCQTPAADGIPRFLRWLAMLREGDVQLPQQEAVRLMTIHGAKGLEFPVVFITGLEEGLLPYCLSRVEIEADAEDPEEERRLFYVGMTRAQEKLYLTYARSRFLFGERRKLPRSSFVDDLPQETVCRFIDPLIAKQMQQKKAPRQMSLFGKS